MAEKRRSLTAGLAVVPPGTDPEAVRQFVTQEPKRSPMPAIPVEPEAEPQPAKKPEPISRVGEGTARGEVVPQRIIRKGKKGPLPVGLVPITVRLKPEIAGGLKRASLELQLAGEEIYTQQDIVEQALEPWLKANGFLL